MAIFEFSSSNGFSSFTLNFECRNIGIIEIEDEYSYHFSYLVKKPYGFRSNTSQCEERGYEEWERHSEWCITTFEG